MSKTFSGDRCVPWLYSQAGVRVEGEPKSVAPAVDEVRARVLARPRSASSSAAWSACSRPPWR
ncbi:hypothetical protein [Nannocystis pusilla]|uniref:hypothetical protein n=1 Tax=Nannocystis pusilla TaxID=889268 RepID=UPI003B799EC1